MPRNNKNAGLSWFRPENYGKLRRLFVDGQTLPASYASWHDAAVARCERLREDGLHVVLVDIEPVEFAQWCSINRYRTDAHARDCFTKLMTYRILTGTRAPFEQQG